MGRIQQIDTEWFVSQYVQGGEADKGLDIIEAWVYIILSCNSMNNCAGAYQIPMKMLTVMTKLERNALEVILTRFEKEGKILYRNGWVIIAEPTELNKQDNPSIQKSAARIIKGLPDFAIEFINKYRKSAKKRTKGETPCPHGVETVPTPSFNLIKLNLTKLNGFEDVKKFFREKYSEATAKTSSNKIGKFLSISEFEEKDLKKRYDEIPDKTELPRAWALYCDELAPAWNELIGLRKFLKDYSDIQLKLA